MQFKGYFRPLEARIKKNIPTLDQLRADPAPIINEDEDRETYGRCDCIFWNVHKYDALADNIDNILEDGGEENFHFVMIFTLEKLKFEFNFRNVNFCFSLK